MTDQRDVPFALAAAKESLETKLKHAVDAYEHWTGGPLEVDLGFVQGARSTAGDEVLRDKIRSLVDDFHKDPVVQETQVQVQKVTAFDSDADGEAVVRVSYAYER